MKSHESHAGAHVRAASLANDIFGALRDIALSSTPTNPGGTVTWALSSACSLSTRLPAAVAGDAVQVWT